MYAVKNNQICFNVNFISPKTSMSTTFKSMLNFKMCI